MATRQPTVIWPSANIISATWTGLLQGDDGGYVTWLQYADRSVQVFGTFGGATIEVEGSNDAANWVGLTDPQGNALSIVSAKIEQIMEACLYIRPRVNGGNGTTSLSAVLVGRA